MLQYENAMIYGGGTDILVALRDRKISADYLVDIHSIEAFHALEETDTSILIGCAVRVSEIENAPLVKQYAPALAEAVGMIGSVQIRNKATLAGNIQTASPAGDGLTAAFGLGANVILESHRGTRVMNLETFLLAPRATAKAADEVISAIEIPKNSWNYQKFFKVGRRNAMAISVVNGLIAAELEDRTVKDIRISLGAVAPTPIRIRAAEDFLRGKVLSEDILEETAHLISDQVHPISDVRASAEYRKYIAGIMVKRQLEGCKNEHKIYT